MSVKSDVEDQQLDRLRNEFTGHRIWRAIRWGGWLGDWVVSLHDPAAGIDPTVIRSNADDLRDTMRSKAERATACRRLR